MSVAAGDLLLPFEASRLKIQPPGGIESPGWPLKGGIRVDFIGHERSVLVPLGPAMDAGRDVAAVGDGKPDLLIANHDSDNVCYSTPPTQAPPPGFAPPADFGAGPNPHSVAVSDLDGEDCL